MDWTGWSCPGYPGRQKPTSLQVEVEFRCGTLAPLRYPLFFLTLSPRMLFIFASSFRPFFALSPSLRRLDSLYHFVFCFPIFLVDFANYLLASLPEFLLHRESIGEDEKRITKKGLIQFGSTEICIQRRTAQRFSDRQKQTGRNGRNSFRDIIASICEFMCYF